MRAVCVVLAMGLVGTAFADEPVPGGAPTPAPEPSPPPPPQPAQQPPEPQPELPPDDERAVAHTKRRGREIKIETPGERTRNNKLMIGAGFGVAAIAGGVGLYFHLDSRDASDQVKSTIPTGKPWTPARAELVEQAESSRTSAIVAYSIGGALVIGAIVAYIVTEPAAETSVIRTTSIVPARGGAVVTTGWRF